MRRAHYRTLVRRAGILLTLAVLMTSVATSAAASAATSLAAPIQAATPAPAGSGSVPPDALAAADTLAASAPFDARAFSRLFQHRTIDIDGRNVHYVEGGEGPAVLLLHGWPETWYSWRRAMPELARHHRVIAIDLPGFGGSAAAPLADKQSIAAIVERFARKVGLGPAVVVGHDMGGTVAYALAAIHPQSVRKLVLMETAIPGFGFADGSTHDILNPTPQSIGGIWHFAFFMKPEIPEMLIAGHERAFVLAVTTDSYSNRAALGEDEVSELVDWLKQPGGVAGGLAYYRALYTDAQQNKQLARRPLAMPVLVLNGADGFLQHILPASARAVASNVSVDVAPGSGHFIAAERPLWLARALHAFAEAPP